ncbi:MAG: EMC3/TMCO1 family protein [Nanoarchaeota archaeon]|nr:EMC3/TMCO1 family protein [Nanoarchaeota archaeon]
MFENFFNFVLGPIMNLPNPLNLFGISFILTGAITFAYKYLTDQNKMKELKTEMKDMQKKMKEHKDQPDKVMSMQKAAMKKNMEYMKHSMKPTLFTFVPIIIVFSWLRGHYEALGNPVIFLGLKWIWVYIIFSLMISIVLRKVMKIN